jgi:hypothetical protein
VLEDCTKFVKYKIMELTKRELEKELIGYDRQKVISKCLKLFEMNRRVVSHNDKIRLMLNDYRKRDILQGAEISRLRSRTVWQVLNENLIRKISLRRAGK